MRSVTARAVRNPLRAWKGDGEELRVGGKAEPVPQATFRLDPGDTVFTIGSCFARNVEEHLVRLGMRVPTLEFSVPMDERQGPRTNSILNKYTLPAIATELRLALALEGPEARTLIDEPEPGQWIDLQLASKKRVSRDRALARRSEVTQLFEQAFAADVIVLTLGQIECWYDAVAGVHINQFPPGHLARANPERFWFERLSLEDNLAWLRWVVGVLQGNGSTKRIIVTVSPVPMTATFQGGDVLQQYVYGKSVLRVVAETLVAEHDGVDYFPAFEAALLSDRHLVWSNDGLHVKDGFVGSVVEQLVATYMAEAPAHA
jgi:GSCFA family